MKIVSQICEIEGCDRGIKARKMCGLHYGRYLKGHKIDAPLRGAEIQSPDCSVSGCSRPRETRGMCRGHYRRATGEINPKHPLEGDGNTRTCRLPNCGEAFFSKGLCAAHYKAQKTYNLSEELLILRDSAVCDICGDAPREGARLSVDHDHSCCPGTKSCGKCIRGLVCNPCNQGLGSFRDDPKRLSSAIKYLQEPPRQ